MPLISSVEFRELFFNTVEWWFTKHYFYFRRERTMNKLIAAVSLGLISFCAIADGAEYTLYRTGIDMPTQKHDETLRIHIATFDAIPLKSIEDNSKYNLANCEFAQEMFASNQPHFRNYRSNTAVSGTVNVKYWCEKGRFRK